MEAVSEPAYSKGGFVPGPPTWVSIDEDECIIRPDETRPPVGMLGSMILYPLVCLREDVGHLSHPERKCDLTTREVSLEGWETP